MEITRPAVESPFAVPAWDGWVARRRAEYERTSTALRVTGAIGWSLVALAVVDMVL